METELHNFYDYFSNLAKLILQLKIYFLREGEKNCFQIQ